MLNKKFYISLSFISLLSVLVWAEKPDAALDSLDACLSRKHLYDQAKQARIDSLQALFTPPINILIINGYLTYIISYTTNIAPTGTTRPMSMRSACTALLAPWVVRIGWHPPK